MAYQSPRLRTAYFDRLTNAQLINHARHHQEKFDRAWKICMTSHHKSGRYIDASVDMDREYKALGSIGEYIYNNRPHYVFTEYLGLNTGVKHG